MKNSQSTKEIAKEIRTALKAEFPSAKFSVTSDYNLIRVILMSDTVSPYASGAGAGYDQINHYYLDNYLEGSGRDVAGHLTNAAVDMLKKVTKISNAKNWDESDIATDYFHCHYYFQLHIGRYDQKFRVV